MDEGTDKEECRRKMASEKGVVGVITSLVIARGLQLECARASHESLFVPVLMYGSETMIWKKKERIRTVQMDNLRGFTCIRKMDKVLNARIRELWGMTKGVGERIAEDVLRGFGHVKRMERDRIPKKVSVEECAGSRSVGM